MGKGALLAKLDFKNAYHNIPIHPTDRWLISVQWGGHVYIDVALPFGLRSAPKIFTAVADALQWIMEMAGIHQVLDDFLFIGPPESPLCAASLAKALDICRRLGFPVAPNKVEGPSTCLTFLGIIIDTMNHQLRLPHPKLVYIKGQCKAWSQRRTCKKRDLQSFLGLLNHAVSVIGSGRTFMRGLIDLLPYGSARYTTSA